MNTLLYISRSTLPQARGPSEVEEIVRLAQARNQSIEVTGALVYSGAHFAQILEGPAAQLSDLMRSINLDVRHKDVTIVKSGPVGKRKFASWHLAYSGQSTFVDRNIRSI